LPEVLVLASVGRPAGDATDLALESAAERLISPCIFVGITEDREVRDQGVHLFPDVEGDSISFDLRRDRLPQTIIYIPALPIGEG
jgi:hypothetical protein